MFTRTKKLLLDFGALFVVLVLMGWVALNTFNSCVTIEASPPASNEYATAETVEALVQVLVKLHDRVTALESRQAVEHTHLNDHNHGLVDNFLDPGHHSHFEYAETEHRHWGYADEFHSHDDGW